VAYTHINERKLDPVIAGQDCNLIIWKRAIIAHAIAAFADELPRPTVYLSKERRCGLGSVTVAFILALIP
jgi:hypothetical protein